MPEVAGSYGISWHQIYIFFGGIIPMKPAATARVLKKVEIVTEIMGFHLEKTAPELNWKLRRNGAITGTRK